MRVVFIHGPAASGKQLVDTDAIEPEEAAVSIEQALKRVVQPVVAVDGRATG